MIMMMEMMMTALPRCYVFSHFWSWWPFTLLWEEKKARYAFQLFLANNIALLYLPLSWNDKKDHLDVHLIGQEETFILMTMLVIIFNAIIICLYNHQHNHNHYHDHFHHNPHRHCHNSYPQTLVEQTAKERRRAKWELTLSWRNLMLTRPGWHRRHHQNNQYHRRCHHQNHQYHHCYVSPPFRKYGEDMTEKLENGEAGERCEICCRKT